MPPELSLIKLIPEGVSVIAVMVTLALGIQYIKFLHYTHKQDKAIQGEAHKTQIAALCDIHASQCDNFKSALEKAGESNKDLLASQKQIMGDHFKVSFEMITAVKGLETAVRALESRIK